MNLGISPSSQIVSGGIRALAHVLAGLESLGVAALFSVTVVGNRVSLPEPNSVFTAALLISAAIITAYLVGLMVDSLATSLWAIWNRERWGKGELKVWARHRTNARLLFAESQSRRQALRPWMAAQEWIWTSGAAEREFGDLRLRMMLGKDTALNAAIGWVVCAVAFVAVPLRANLAGSTLLEGVCRGGADGPWVLLAASALLTGLSVTWAQCRVLKVPGFGVRRRLRKWGRIGPNWGLWLSLLFGAGCLAMWWYVQSSVPGLFRCFGWLTPAVALGPLVVFGFVHVRLEANALYHRKVRDASAVGRPSE